MHTYTYIYIRRRGSDVGESKVLSVDNVRGKKKKKKENSKYTHVQYFILFYLVLFYSILSFFFFASWS